MTNLRFTPVVVLLAILAINLAEGHDHWAVLVSGSQGYWNYRHQADVCHAYQIMKNHGIPDEQIIVFSYDDVADDPENPFPGKLFNQPNGTDVYTTCKIDYRKDKVTPTNFLAVLQGNPDGTLPKGSKILNTTAESKVFIYFTDHGAPGLVAFPTEVLYADQFLSALTNMSTKAMYEQMVIYIEACEAGSMFEGLLDPKISIYAVTASNARESSWGTYCYPDDQIQGKHLGTCLGDLFSVNWMEDADKQNLHKETLAEQFELVKKLTTQSHVMQYGDLSFVEEPVGDFEGNYDDQPASPSFLDSSRSFDSFFYTLYTHAQSYFTPAPSFLAHSPSISSIDSRDAKLHHLYAKVSMQPSNHKAALDLSMELTRRMRIDHVFEELMESSNNEISMEKVVLPRNFQCLREFMGHYQQECWPMDEYDYKYVKLFVQECEAISNIPATNSQTHKELIENFKFKIQSACTH